MTGGSPRCAASVNGRSRRAVVHPEARPVDAEQRERLVDDVVEQAGQLAAAAHLRRDAAQRIGAGGIRR
jgi:hypothetical protein